MKRRSLLQTAVLGAGIFLLAPARVRALGGTSPEIGIKAPDFDLLGFSSVNPDQNHWSLTSLQGRWLVVYFYPRDFTSGCTIEAHGFQEALPEFKKQRAEVVAISADSVSDHESFCSSEELKFPLLSDPDGVVRRLTALGWRHTRCAIHSLSIQSLCFKLHGQEFDPLVMPTRCSAVSRSYKPGKSSARVRDGMLTIARQS